METLGIEELKFSTDVAANIIAHVSVSTAWLSDYMHSIMTTTAWLVLNRIPNFSLAQCLDRPNAHLLYLMNRIPSKAERCAHCYRVC